MLLSAVSVLVVAQSISEIPEGVMNNPVFKKTKVLNMYVLCDSVTDTPSAMEMNMDKQD